MFKLPSYLTSDDLPVMTASNFWRATQSMKQSERENTLTPHLIIPELKNHRHIGGIVPGRLFTAFIMFCRDNNISINQTQMKGAHAKTKMQDQGTLFEGDEDCVYITFEEKKGVPFSVLVAVSPDAFHTFHTVYESGKLKPYLQKVTASPMHYSAETNLSIPSLINLRADFGSNSVFMRVLPPQSKETRQDKVRVKVQLTEPVVEGFSSVADALNARNSNVMVGNIPFKIQGVEKGRPTYSDDPDVSTLANCNADLKLRMSEKRPVDSIHFDFNGSTAVVGLLTTANPTLRIRLNHHVWTLAA